MGTLSSKVNKYEKYYDGESSKYDGKLNSLQNSCNSLVGKVNELQQRLSASHKIMVAQDREIKILKQLQKNRATRPTSRRTSDFWDGAW